MLEIVLKVVFECFPDVLEKYFSSVHDSTADHNLLDAQSEGQVAAHSA